MQKAGGIIALIGGVSGLWVALILMLLSAMRGTWDVSAPAEATLATWSLLTTILAVIAIRAKGGKTTGILLVVAALLGPVILLTIAVTPGKSAERLTGAW